MTKGNLAEGSFHCARVQIISGEPGSHCGCAEKERPVIMG